MSKKNRSIPVNQVLPTVDGCLHCACVIIGNSYSWEYVEILYNMLKRHLTPIIQLHVYTEDSRQVPAHMIKHSLVDWGLIRSDKLWWYKMQLFNSRFYSGPLLYFDLDVVIIKNIDYFWQLPLQYLWGVRDFKHLWRPAHYSTNSSILWWNTLQFDYIWQDFIIKDRTAVMRQLHGDQDYLTKEVMEKDRRYFSTELVKSWRWQALDGGFNFKRRSYLNPNSGTTIDDKTGVLVFHGKPKPHQTIDKVIKEHWR